ncbi:MAG: hypothetical protein ACE5GJ_07565 [Gemmatimonadota bacterium]
MSIFSSTCLACAAHIEGRYCTRCGSPAPGGDGEERPLVRRRWGWALASLVFFGLSVWAAWATVGRGAAAAAVNPASDLQSDLQVEEERLGLAGMDPREMADHLFNQVVDAAAAGDTMQVAAFLPVALAAYAEAEPLDADGMFHLATLLQVGRRFDEALNVARATLDEVPEHLLALGVAAEATSALGRPDEARASYAALIDAYEREVAEGRPEYGAHAAVVRRLQQQALRALDAAGVGGR